MGVNATTSVPVYADGQILDASRLNITNSGIPVFATTTTRDAAFGGTGEKTLAEGQYAYIEANNETQYYDGAAWKTVVLPYTSYTPTWTNLTVGNATQDWAYSIVGDTVIVTGGITLGSTSAVGTNPYMTLPVLANTSNIRFMGQAALGDAATATYLGLPLSTDSVGVYFFVLLTNGTYGSEGVVTATVPFTWGNGDFIRATIIYRRG